MKILSAAQISALDQHTIVYTPISSTDLMERAASSFTDWLFGFLPYQSSVYVFCGTGNNGGDGLVVARLLHHVGFPVQVFLLPGTLKPDAALNLNRLQELNIPVTTDLSSLPSLNAADWAIDALFGVGLNRPLSGEAARLVRWLNEQPCQRVAIDIPSGLLADEPTPPDAAVFQAHRTATFQLPKLAFMMSESAPFLGDWEILPIGLSESYMESSCPTEYFFTLWKDLQGFPQPRRRFAHKGDFGHVLLVGGSRGKNGAMLLAGKGVLRAGAGLLTLAVPANAYPIVQTALPEAMCLPDPHPDHLTELPDIGPFSVVAAGPGMGTHPQTKQVLEQIISSQPTRLVLDADALNLLAQEPDWWHTLPRNTILTPHPGEFDRLTGTFRPTNWERLAQLKSLCKKFQVIIVLKGAFTAVGLPDGTVHFNTTGNPGMATGGSGDTLTGIIAGMLACGYPPALAARAGVWIHGRAADLAVRQFGQPGLIASDIAELLGKVWREMRKQDNNTETCRWVAYTGW